MRHVNFLRRHTRLHQNVRVGFRHREINVPHIDFFRRKAARNVTADVHADLLADHHRIFAGVLPIERGKTGALAHDVLKAALLHFAAENALRHWASARVAGADKQNFHL